jgi:hypothetical protein
MEWFFVARVIAGALVIGWALAAGVVAGSGTAEGQTVLRGSLPAARPAQPAPAVCPDAYYYSDGLCRPYSWHDVTTGENELQPLYPLPVLTR